MMLHDLYQIFKIPLTEAEQGGAGNFTIAVILLCIVDGLSVYLYPTKPVVGDQKKRFKKLLRKKLYWGSVEKEWVEKDIAAKQFYNELRNLLVHELGADMWTSGRIDNHSEPRIGKWGSIPEASRDIDIIQDMSIWNDDWPILKIDRDDNGEEFVQFSGAVMWWVVKRMIIDLINNESVLENALSVLSDESK